jgi:hypothetical protein
MKMIKTISILILCLAVNLLVGAEFVPGEMSLSQASETYGGACDCLKGAETACATTCSVSGNKTYIKSVSSGFDYCTATGDGACGDCNDNDGASCRGPCSDD